MRLFSPILSLVIFFASTALAVQPDCSTLILDYSGLVYYKDTEVFPNPQKEHQIALAQITKPITQSLCGITISADAKSFSFQAKSISALSEAMRGHGLGWTIVPLGLQNSRYIEAAQIYLRLPDGLVEKQVTLEGYPTNNYFTVKTLIGLKLDNGPIKPVLYNGSFRKNIIPGKTELIELYIKDDKPLVWQKMTLDAANYKMTFTKKAAFPSK